MNKDQRSSRRRTRGARRSSLPLLARALAEHDRPGLRRRTYVADRLVLTVVQHDAPNASVRDGRSNGHKSNGHKSNGHAEPDPVLLTSRFPQQLRTIVESLVGRRVTAMLSGHQADPDVSFALFMLQE